MMSKNTKAAGAGTPCGGCINYLPHYYTAGDGKEQLKITKLTWLLDLCLQINGTKERKQGVTKNLPTVFFSISGHTASVTIDIFLDGWKDTDTYNPDKNIHFYMDDEDFAEKCTNAYRYLSELKWKMDMFAGGQKDDVQM